MKIFALNFCITGIVILFLIAMCDIQQAWTSIKSANIYLVIISVGLVFLHLIFVGERWKVAFQGYNQQVKSIELIKIIFVGQFLRQFMPSSIISELVKMQMCKKIGLRMTFALSSSVIDRFSGIAMLGLMVVGITIFFNTNVKLDYNAFYFLLLLLILFYFLFRIIVRKNKNPSIIFGNRVTSLIDCMASFRISLFGFFKLSFFSLAANILIILSVYVTALSINVPITFIQAFIVIPLALVMSMIPISFGGWGVREASFVYVFSLNSINSSDALATSFLYGLVLTFTGLISGVFLPKLSMFDISFALKKNV